MLAIEKKVIETFSDQFLTPLTFLLFSGKVWWKKLAVMNRNFILGKPVSFRAWLSLLFPCEKRGFLSTTMRRHVHSFTVRCFRDVKFETCSEKFSLGKKYIYISMTGLKVLTLSEIEFRGFLYQESSNIVDVVVMFNSKKNIWRDVWLDNVSFNLLFSLFSLSLSLSLLSALQKCSIILKLSMNILGLIHSSRAEARPVRLARN